MDDRVNILEEKISVIEFQIIFIQENLLCRYYENEVEYARQMTYIEKITSNLSSAEKNYRLYFMLKTENL